jgi:hypothetical protein
MRPYVSLFLALPLLELLVEQLLLKELLGTKSTAFLLELLGGDSAFLDS